MAWPGEKPFQIEFGGLNTSSDPSVAYPYAIEATNVRFGRFGGVMKRTGYAKYNLTAMSSLNAITGIAQFNRRDTSTRYTIVGDKDRLWVCPTSGAWTELAASMGATITDYWDFAVFNNEIICVNGVTTPQISDGTAAGTGALVGQAAVTVRTAMTTAQGLPYGLHNVEDGLLIAAGGAPAAGSFDGRTQAYDTIGDVWSTKKRATVNRDSGSGFMSDGLVYLVSGIITGPALNATMEVYDHLTDTWTTKASVTAARRETVGAAANNGGFNITGNTDASSAAWTTTNYFYDPVTNAWSTKAIYAPDAARRGAVGFVLGQSPHVLSGKITAADAYDAEHSEYDPFGNAWTDLTDITAARFLAGGASGKDNLGYVCGGITSAPAESNVIYAYNRAANTWSTVAATLTTAKSLVGVGADDWNIYIAGGAVSTTAQTSVDRLNTSPAAPVAKYIDTYKGQVLMARTSSAPSRLFYSAPGDARVWDPFAYIDINPDDGDWITAVFVFDGRLYVSKTDVIYRIDGDAPFDPLEAIPSPVPMEGAKGTVSNRSVVITDMGVFYLAEDGFRMFNGSRSVKIGEEIQATIDGYQQSRMKYVCGVWVRERDEIWWGMSEDSSISNDRVLCFNTRWKKWSVFGMDGENFKMESVAAVETANDIENILFGSGDATVGFIFNATTSVGTDNAAAITSTYQTGWFHPDTGVNLVLPKDLFMWWKRVTSTTPTVSLRANYSNVDTAEGGTTFTDDILLTGVVGGSAYFESNLDQRCRVPMAAAATSHSLSLRITNDSTHLPWELYGAILVSVKPLADGGFPT